MDPVIRVVSDIRRLKIEVTNPFDKAEVVRYLCALADELGFNPLKNLRAGPVKIECGWRDGQDLFLAANIEFGSEREVLGAAAEIMVARPVVGLLITASNSIKPIENVVGAVRGLRPGFDFLILDLNGEKTIRV